MSNFDRDNRGGGSSGGSGNNKEHWKERFPPQSRIFLGNLASEKTSKEELSSIFNVYGHILEVVIRKSFGFVQYDNRESAEKAIQAENGRFVGGTKLGRKKKL